MKKIILLTLLTFSFCNNPLAILTSYSGNVFFQKAGSTAWVDVSEGTVFYPNDKLKTAEYGKAEIFFYSGSRSRLSAETEIEFNPVVNNKKTTNLTIGKLWNNVRKGDNFELKTIHGVASVKGTSFGAEVNQQFSTFWVENGSVQIFNDIGEILAYANTKSNLYQSQKPVLSIIDSKELPDWKETSDNIVVIEPEISKINKIGINEYLLFVNFKGYDKNQVDFSIQTSAEKSKISLNNENWSSQIKAIIPKEGVLSFYLKIEGDDDIRISGNNMKTLVFPVNNLFEKEKNKINLEVMDEEKNIHSVEIYLK